MKRRNWKSMVRPNGAFRFYRAKRKPNHFYDRNCRKDVYVLPNGPHNLSFTFQEPRHFPRGQRLQLEKLVWWLFGFDNNAPSGKNLDRQRAKLPW